MPRQPATRKIKIHGGTSASTATICPIEDDSAINGSPVIEARAMMGTPRAPKDTGALLAIAATRIASRSGIFRLISSGATTAQG